MNKIIAASILLLSLNSFATSVCILGFDSFTYIECDGADIPNQGASRSKQLKQYTDKGYKIVTHSYNPNGASIYTLTKD